MWKKKEKIKKITEGEINPLEDTGEQSTSDRELTQEDLTLQKFLDDMQFIGNQIRSGDIKKPNFDYGQTAITNYLLWLIYGQLLILNKKKIKT